MCLLLTVPAHARAEGPPGGLTQSGRNLWDLEALLHDTFGTREVWIHYLHGTGPRAVWNFSTAETALCCGAPWNYTFATARGSQFVLRRPARPIAAQIGASGGEIPLTVRGAYITCGHRRWLHIHFGNGTANTLLTCLKAYRP